MNKLSEKLIVTINAQFSNFSARFDKQENDIVITDNHHQQFRLQVDDQASKPVDRLKYLIMENPVVASSIEITNNNQLGDYALLLHCVYTTIANA